MVKVILIVVVLAIAGVLIFAATKPDTFRVQRSATIKAPPERIFALVNDLGSWRSWSPYETKDPNMRRTFGNVTAGKGAVYEWDGDKNVGQGRMEIMESTPPSRVGIKLDFFKPFEAHNTAEFTMEPQGDATNVTWTIFGPMPYVSKLMTLFFDMDRMIGADFEVGLAKLKTVAEQ